MGNMLLGLDVSLTSNLMKTVERLPELIKSEKLWPRVIVGEEDS